MVIIVNGTVPKELRNFIRDNVNQWIKTNSIPSGYIICQIGDNYEIGYDNK